MTISVNFNGVNLSELTDGITSIERDFGGTWTNNLGASGVTRYGQDFVNNSLGPKTIVVTFIKDGVPGDWVAIKQAIAKLLDVSKPAPLIFGDEPNKIWYAVPDQLPTFAEDITTLRATGTLTFLVPSGCAVSSFSKVLNSANSGGEIGTITKNADNSIDVLLNNQGTLPVFPTIKFTHTSDNAYIGITGVEKVMGLGSQEQHLIDSSTTETTKVQSEWLLNPSGISQKDNFDKRFMTANDVPNPQNGQLLTAGNLVWKQDGLRLQDGGPPPDKDKVYSAVGAMQQFTVPADSTGSVGSVDFTSTFNIWGQTLKMGQTGILQMLFVDGNNKLIAGMGIYKDDTRGNSFQTQLYIGGNHPQTFETFGPRLQELNNGGHGDGKVPNPNLYFNSTTGYFTIQKKGPVFNFTFGNRGGNYQKVISELSNTKCMKVYIYEGQLKGRDIETQYISNLTLRSFNFQKNDVTKTIDSTTDVTKYIPADDHHFGNHEVVMVDMEGAAIYRREGKTIANDEMVKGGEFFSIPPGQSKITCMFGDGASPPEIEVTIQERYL